ncbi:MAG: hypothetical protein ACFCUX_01270 [Candidatus Methylacidiphilales bacterium]
MNKLALANVPHLSRVCLVAFTCLLSATGATHAEEVGDLPLNPDYNVARSSWGSGLLYISDIVVQSDSPDPLLNEKIDLINDDETLTSELPEGRSLFMIRLKDSSIVNSFRFYNFGARGAAMAYVRATESDSVDVPWIPVSDTVTFDAPGPVVLWFNQEIEAKLVRIVFDTAEPGLISGFGVAGSFFRGASPKTTQLVRQTQATDNQALTNVLSFSSGADVIGTSGGIAPNSKAMIDDLVETAHVFSETESEPVALVDLGQPREIERVSVLISSDAPSTMELYFIEDPSELEEARQPVALHDRLNALPKWASRSSAWIPMLAQMGRSISEITVPKSFFDNRTPNVVAEFEAGSRRARANTGGSTFSQYVLIRWVYKDGLPAEFGGLVVNELNFLGRYVWYYEDDPESPAESPANEAAFALSPVTTPDPVPENPPVPPTPPLPPTAPPTPPPVSP